MIKEHKEFHPVAMDSGWETPPGYPAGIQQKILSGSLDEQGMKGTRTRLLRFDAGIKTTEPFVHDYFEEVYLISGDLIVGKDGSLGTFDEQTYACRPPQTPHGPFESKNGCLLLEVHFFE
jgi:hypothetical protein